MICQETDAEMLKSLLSAFSGQKGGCVFAARILDSLVAYGADRAFLPFFRFGPTGQEGVFSRQDGGLLLVCQPGVDLRELASYLSADPPGYLIGAKQTVKRLVPHLSSVTQSVAQGNLLLLDDKGKQRLAKRVKPFNQTHLPRGCYPTFFKALPCQQHLDAVWSLFSLGFAGFDRRDRSLWYGDFSHRLRHQTLILAGYAWGSSCLCGCGVNEGSPYLRYLFDLTTAPGFRGAGLASNLLCQLAGQDARPIYLGTQTRCLTRYYQRLGFAKSGRWMQIFWKQ